MTNHTHSSHITGAKRPHSHRGRPLTVARDEVIRIAAEQLRTLGPAKFSMKTVADAVGVTSMALYHHFESKDELIGQVYLHNFIHQPVEEELPHVIRGRLIRLAELMVEQLDRFPSACQFIIGKSEVPLLVGWPYEQFLLTAYNEAGMEPLAIAVATEQLRRVVIGEVIARHTVENRSPGAPACDGCPPALKNQEIFDEGSRAYDLRELLASIVDRLLQTAKRVDA